jgi:hypothetical protein
VYFLGNIIPTIGTNNFTAIQDNAYYLAGISGTDTKLSAFTNKISMDPPTNLQIKLYAVSSSATSGGIFTSWESISNIFTDYEITVYDDQNVSILQTQTNLKYKAILATDTTPNLINGKSYTFNVKGKNADVFSPASVKSNAQLYNSKIFYSVNTVDNTASVSGFQNAPTVETIIPEVNIGGNNYQVKRIGNSAFLGCNTLTSITLPNSVTTIGE